MWPTARETTEKRTCGRGPARDDAQEAIGLASSGDAGVVGDADESGPLDAAERWSNVPVKRSEGRQATLASWPTPNTHSGGVPFLETMARDEPQKDVENHAATTL